MHGRGSSFASRIVRIVFVAVLVSGLSAQASELRRRVGLPEDWSHHHVKVNTAALRQHPELASREPRAAFQLYREAQAALARISSSSMHAAGTVSQAQHGDWSVLSGTGRLAPGQYPAKFTGNPFTPVTLANCNTDFVVFGLNVASSVGSAGTQANLIGLNNLYSSQTTPALCGTSPTFLFAYNITTATGGRIATSPVLSLDSKKVAFIETVPNPIGSRRTIPHVLNIPTSNPGPGFPQGSSAAAPALPPAGAMTSLTIVSNSDTRSSPWVDYATDTLYVAPDDGKLYKISPVFGGGTPALAGAPWPLLIAAAAQLTSPVIDDVTGRAFMGDGTGRVYAVNVNSPGAVTAKLIGTPGMNNPGVLDSPIIDSTAGTLLATTSNDSTTLNSAAVVQINTATLAEINRVSIGMGSTGAAAVPLYGGDFDNTYFSTPASGHMLVCGTAASTTIPTLYSLSFDSAAHLLSAAPLAAVSTNAGARCGPITEFFNSNIGGGTDSFFFGVSRNCTTGAGVANGCVMSRRTVGGVTTTAAVASTTGTSGIIPDNNSTAANASSIYFTNQGGPNNAYKLTQQGLN